MDAGQVFGPEEQGPRAGVGVGSDPILAREAMWDHRGHREGEARGEGRRRNCPSASHATEGWCGATRPKKFSFMLGQPISLFQMQLRFDVVKFGD